MLNLFYGWLHGISRWTCNKKQTQCLYRAIRGDANWPAAPPSYLSMGRIFGNWYCHPDVYDRVVSHP